MEFDIDCRSDIFNFDEDSLEDVIFGIKQTLDEFRGLVGDQSIYVNTNGKGISCAILPVMQGDFVFWIGGQV